MYPCLDYHCGSKNCNYCNKEDETGPVRDKIYKQGALDFEQELIGKFKELAKNNRIDRKTFVLIKATIKNTIDSI